MSQKKQTENGFCGDLFPDFFPSQEQPAETSKVSRSKKSELKSAKQNAEVQELQQINQELLAENQCLLSENVKLKAKADLVDELFVSTSLFPTNIVAKSFGWSAIKLNQYLNKKGIQYKRGEVWVLYQKYASEGYTKVGWFTYGQDSKGHELTRAHTYWTMKGIAFIRELLKKDGQISD